MTSADGAKPMHSEASSHGDRPPRTEAEQRRDERAVLLDGDVARLPEFRVSLGWLDALTRHRRIVFVGIALLYVLGFNGIWRVNVDSALYRGLGHSMATGGGYTFAGAHHEHAFFGLPLMLAACEKVFGVTPLPPQILITLMGLATLWLTDRLIRLRFPLWMATLVTIGMALNFRFFRQSQELMTDVPFALGVVASLYGLDLLRLTPWRERGPAIRAAATFLAGLALAAATRPTFGVLAGAILLSSLVRAIHNRDGRRGLHVLIAGSAIGITVLLFLSDPRTRGFNPTQGVYEQELIERVQVLNQTILGSLDKFLTSNLNDAFYSQKMQPIGSIFAIAVLAGTFFLIRRDLTWGLMVIGLVLVTLPLSTVPRYYIMVMPLLWLGWLLLLSRLVLVSPPVMRGAVMMLGIALPLAVNVGRMLNLIAEQRRPDLAWLRTGADRTTSFYAKYHEGMVPRLKAIADMIRANTTPAQKIVGPEAHVLTYYADRHVVGERTIFLKVENKITQYPAELKRFDPDLAIFPFKAYDDSDRQVRDLIRRRILAPLSAPIARTADAYLAAAEVKPPPGVNWKSFKATAPDENSSLRAELRGLSTTQQAAVREKRARRAAIEARHPGASTNPSKYKSATTKQAKPSTQPAATKPVKKAKSDRTPAQDRKAKKNRQATTAATTQPISP